MARKINVLVIIVFSIFFMVIVNAAEDTNTNLINEPSNLSNSNSTINEELDVNTNSTRNNTFAENIQTGSTNSSIIDNNIPNPITYSPNANKNEGKSATASFGVYLKIVG